MALVNSLLASFQQDEEGQGLAEYALILALIAIVAIVALIFLGGQVSTILSHGRRLDLVAHANTQPSKAAGHCSAAFRRLTCNRFGLDECPHAPCTRWSWLTPRPASTYVRPRRDRGRELRGKEVPHISFQCTDRSHQS